MLIGQKMKYYRGRNQLTLNDLSKLTGLAASYLSALENEQQMDLSIKTLRCIADVLKVSPGELLAHDTGRLNEAILEKKEWENIVLDIYKTGCSKHDFREFIVYRKWKNTVPVTF